MFAFLLMLSSCFFITSAKDAFTCPESCVLTRDQEIKLCGKSNEPENAVWAPNSELIKQTRRANVEGADTSKARKLGTLDLNMPKNDKEHSPRLTLMRQQLQNLENFALYDYYVRAMRNYE